MLTKMWKSEKGCKKDPLLKCMDLAMIMLRKKCPNVYTSIILVAFTTLLV